MAVTGSDQQHQVLALPAADHSVVAGILQLLDGTEGVDEQIAQHLTQVVAGRIDARASSK